MKLFPFLISVLSLFTAFSALADVVQLADNIYVGAYISSVDPSNQCTVIVKNEASLINKDRFTVEVISQNINLGIGSDYTIFDVTSDVFSMKALKNEIKKETGEYYLSTKKSTYTSNSISGILFEKAGSVYWTVTVSKNTCFGLCSGEASACTVRIK
jgi:hypothetical protein